MDKFEILHKILVNKDLNLSCGNGVTIKYCSHKHSTGHQIHIYLVHGERSLLVYRDSKWIRSSYAFNDSNKVKGWIERGPWEAVIKQQFKEWSDLIAEKSRRAREQAEYEKSEKERKQAANIRHFEKRFTQM